MSEVLSQLGQHRWSLALRRAVSAPPPVRMAELGRVSSTASPTVTVSPVPGRCVVWRVLPGRRGLRAPCDAFILVSEASQFVVPHRCLHANPFICRSICP